ncbi:MAG TPA: Re/Si-specific NAD(P)(+) transhydrogenase subunit alpha [Chloroflexota bacterium]
MQVGVPREQMAGERRVALTPEIVSSLVGSGMTVVVEAGAGDSASHSDAAYQEVGAVIAADRLALCASADVLVHVQHPSSADVSALRENTVVIGFLQPLLALDLVRQLRDRRLTSFSMDAIPRIARAQDMDALSSMSTISGYRAVILAAAALPRFFPLLMTAAGVVTPARVFVLGAGVAGLQAIGTARRLGAVVEAFDTRPVVKEQVSSLGAHFVELPVQEQAGGTADGYARQLSAEAEGQEQALISRHVAESDVVITTALVPGKRAPILVTADAVAQMRPGSVIVDLAAEAGGNCALTRPGAVRTVHGITIIGTTNLPSQMPEQASQLYARTLFNLLRHLAPKGELQLDFSDAITAGACVTHDGKIVNAAVRALVDGGEAVALAATGRREA